MNYNQRYGDEYYDDEYYYDDNCYFDYDDYYYDEDFDINDFKTLNAYFNYYRENYGFRYYSIGNAVKLFYQLAKFMQWSNEYSYQLNYFNRTLRTNYERREYFKEMESETGWKEDSRYNLNENFEDLSEYMHWKEYQEKEEEFNKFVAILCENRFRTIRECQKIIKWYKLDEIYDEMPKNLKDCRNFLIDYLFVNIYDFVAGNKKRFNNLKKLKTYTQKNDLYYPLEEAKEKITYKVLLKKLLR